jgi:hypothetical protein
MPNLCGAYEPLQPTREARSAEAAPLPAHLADAFVAAEAIASHDRAPADSAATGRETPHVEERGELVRVHASRVAALNLAGARTLEPSGEDLAGHAPSRRRRRLRGREVLRSTARHAGDVLLCDFGCNERLGVRDDAEQRLGPRVRCAYKIVSRGCSLLQFAASRIRAICSIFQVRVTRRSSFFWTFNPKVGGSNPPRPI